MARKADCSEYRKLAVQPDDEVQALLQALRATARQRTGRRTARLRATGQVPGQGQVPAPGNEAGAGAPAAQ